MTVARMTSYLAPTLRDSPADAELPSHKLLVRAGYIRPVGAGIYSLMPLGLRAVRKVESILREEMNAVGGQEVLLPVTQPAELWRESGRWDQVGDEMLRFKDRVGREMCLAMTHEEAVVHLVRKDVSSYRQLPIMLYQLQTKFRDEPRARGGLIRVREFTMKDAYSFHETEESLEEWYRMLYDAYARIFDRCGLKFLAVESDPGMMGGKTAHEFIAPSEFGEDTIIHCNACSYSANRQVALFRREPPSAEAELPLEEVATPNCRTIDEVAGFLGIESRQTAKAVFYHGANRGLIFAVLRGDYEINETHLMRAAGESELRPALTEEIRAIGAEPGYASPIGVKNAFVIADTSITEAKNLVSGANRDGFHLRNVNLGRDFQPDLVAEIAVASAGARCVRCGGELAESRGIEVGNIFKLGTRYSESMGAVFQDRNGQDRPFIMGCYGIGSGRLMASIVEQSHDKDGIIWPASIAPFDVAVLIANRDQLELAERVVRMLEDSGREVLFDDRDVRAGVMFKDADLIGLPVRVTVGRKAAEGILEVRNRATGEVCETPVDELLEVVGSGYRSRTGIL